MRAPLFYLLAMLASAACPAGEVAFIDKPADAYFDKFQPRKGPAIEGSYLKKGDRLAICGDSITEQRMYSRILETYLTVCVPELEVQVRQFGWSGETASGFLARMTNDCLRFHPTIATTCYGMNDHGYRPYEDSIGQKYREKSTAIVDAFQAAGARVVQGSPGCVGRIPPWSKATNATVEHLNLNLCELRNIGLEIAGSEHVRFADLFWPMLVAGRTAQQRFGPDYAIAGKDGVHPGWAGSFVMAYAFLKALGVDGDIGTIRVNLENGSVALSPGHSLVHTGSDGFEIESTRYPFCATNIMLASDNSIRSAMALVPFPQEMNRLILVATTAPASRYDVRWGGITRRYRAEQLVSGINLAQDFPQNPFWDAFNRVDQAVKTKQEYETKQIKQCFHDLTSGRYKTAAEIQDPELRELFGLRKPDGQFDLDAIARETEKKRAPLVAAVRQAFTPVRHAIRIVPVTK